MLPLAVTVVEEKYFQGFSGGAECTFYHGHSYSGNALACSVALANLDVFEEENFWQHHAQRETWLRQASQIFWKHPNVGDVRQEGHILAVELVKDVATREPFDPVLRLGHAVCQKAREHGLLTRPVGNVLVLMPPYCCTQTQIETMVHALYRALGETIV
jgi:adenosylmethionine-8-amino-7-oxononanoate aminotransferase